MPNRVDPELDLAIVGGGVDRSVARLARTRDGAVGDGARARDGRAGHLACGGGDARAGSRGRVRRRRAGGARAGAALGGDVAGVRYRARAVQWRARWGCAGRARWCSRATRTRRASSSARSLGAIRWACARHVSAERGPRARAGARADDAAGDGSARRPLRRSAQGARGVAPARVNACGVTLREHASVGRVELDDSVRARATGIGAGGRRAHLPPASVVIAAGAWTGELEGLPERRARVRCAR